MIAAIAETDMVKVSFEIQKEELGYYQEAFIVVTQACLRSELGDSERNSLSLVLNVAQELIQNPDPELYHAFDLRP